MWERSGGRDTPEQVLAETDLPPPEPPGERSLAAQASVSTTAAFHQRGRVFSEVRRISRKLLAY
jgi:hypothetical protein